MSTTWGSNTWGSNSWESDQNTIIPSSNVISTSSGTVDSYQLDGWGGQFWGVQSWGNLTDAFATVTGLQLTPSLGAEDVTGEINAGWGGGPYGENRWGIAGDVLATGSQLNLTLEQVTVDAQIQIGWGGLAWGEGEWGDLANPDILVSGNQINATAETPTIKGDANVDVTGSEVNTVLGNEVAGTSVLVTPNSNEITSSVNHVFGGELVIVEVTSPANDEWGTEYWGAGQFGVGDGITVITGTETEHIADGNVSVSGIEFNTDTGSLGQASIYEFPNPATATVSLTDVFGGELVEVQVSTASAAPWGYAPFGDGQWGQGIGTDISIGGEEVAVPSVEVDVTSVSATAQVEEVSVTGDSNLTLTALTQLDMLQGDEDAFTNVRVEPTGQELGPIVIGDFLAGISITAEPTGVTSTVSTGIMGINAWAVVDPGTSPTWTVVDKAA